MLKYYIMLYEQKEILYFCFVEKICIKIEKKWRI